MRPRTRGSRELARATDRRTRGHGRRGGSGYADRPPGFPVPRLLRRRPAPRHLAPWPDRLAGRLTMAGPMAGAAGSSTSTSGHYPGDRHPLCGLRLWEMEA